MAEKVTFYAFDWIFNGLGMWARSWHTTEEEARTERQKMIDEGLAHELDEDDELSLGGEGELGEIYPYECELTPEGVRTFIACHGDPNGD